MDMFEEMKTAAYLQKVNTMEPTSIKAYDILKMATIEGARVLGLDNEIGSIEVGKKANMTVIDLDEKWIVDASKFKSKCRISPFDNFELKGKAIMTIINGKMINIGQ